MARNTESAPPDDSSYLRQKPLLSVSGAGDRTATVRSTCLPPKPCSTLQLSIWGLTNPISAGGSTLGYLSFSSMPTLFSWTALR